MGIADRYHDSLQRIPAPGTGCHPALLGVANLGIMAGQDPADIRDAIANAIPTGGRTVPQREIDDAIRRAQQDHQTLDSTTRRTFTRPRVPPAIDGTAARERILSKGGDIEEVDLWDASPIRLMEEPTADPGLFLQTMFQPDDLLFIGGRNQAGAIGDTIRTAAAWGESFQNGEPVPPQILCNPLSAQPAATKDGKTTLRGDASVGAFRHCIVEFDNISMEDQLNFWAAIPLPVKALIDSGNKSIHAWVDVSGWRVTDPASWQKIIRRRLYDRSLTPMGADPACANPARLARMPGRHRTTTGRWQRIIWLSAKGQKINGITRRTKQRP